VRASEFVSSLARDLSFSTTTLPFFPEPAALVAINAAPSSTEEGGAVEFLFWADEIVKHNGESLSAHNDNQRISNELNTNAHDVFHIFTFCVRI